MDIVRLSFKPQEKISDLTADASGQLFAFGTFEYYYRDFPEVNNRCSELFNSLIEFNEQLKNHDLPGNTGIKDKLWVDHFNKNRKFNTFKSILSLTGKDPTLAVSILSDQLLTSINSTPSIIKVL